MSKKIMLLGSGELGKEFAIAAKRLVDVVKKIAMDNAKMICVCVDAE